MSVVKFSMHIQADYQLSPHFKVREFACKDGSDAVFIDTELIALLEDLRNHYKAPITILSGYRTPDYNKSVGGATASQHMEGTAADIRIKGVSPEQVYNDCDVWHKGGLGKYPTFTHIDVRKKRTRWSYA